MLSGLDPVVAERDVEAERTERRVVLEQVRHRLRVADVVGRDELEVAAPVEVGAEEVPPDSAEAVDPDLDLRHEKAFRKLKMRRCTDANRGPSAANQ